MENSEREPDDRGPDDRGPADRGPADRDDAQPERSEPTAGNRASEQATPVDDVKPADEGPGCMPAILAATVLMGIIGFVTCGVTTWMLYGKRTELAIRTLEETYLPGVEQSRLEPDEKQQVVTQLRELIADLKRDQLEDWQAGGVMQRLVRTPVIQWGELNAIDAWLRRVDPVTWATLGMPEIEDARRQISRLRRAVELDQATGVDLNDVLKPVVVQDDSPLGRSLLDPEPLFVADATFAADAKLTADAAGATDAASDDEIRPDAETPPDDEVPPPSDPPPPDPPRADPAETLGDDAAEIGEAIVDVVKRARRVADRAEVPDREFPDVQISTIVRRQIEAGIRDGSY